MQGGKALPRVKNRTAIFSQATATLAVGLAVFLLAMANLLFTREVGRIAAVWTPNAMVLAILLQSGRRSWWGYLASALAGNVAADLLIGDTAPIALVLAGCNTLEVILAATLMRRFIPGEIDLARRKDLLVFLVAAGLVGPLASAGSASLVLHASRNVEFWSSLAGWWAPDALGLLIVTPALLVLTREALVELAAKLAAGRGLAPIAMLAVSLGVTLSQERVGLVFLIPPALIFVAFELNLAGAALAVLATSAVALVTTLNSHGPSMLMHIGLGGRLAVVQAFLLTQSLSILPVAAAIERRDRLQLAQLEANRQSQLAHEIAGVGYWRRDLRTNTNVWSDGTYRLHGLPVGSQISGGRALDHYPPEDRAQMIATIGQARKNGRPFDLKVSLNRADDGRERIVLFRGEAERNAAGQVIAIFGVVRDVTEDEHSRQLISESEARYRQLTDASTDVVVKLNLKDEIEYVSPSVSRFGYAPEDLIGRTGSSLGHPDDLAKMEAINRELFATGVADLSRDRTYRLRVANGDYVWMEGNPTIVRDVTGAPVAVVSQLRDISERVATTAALAESELRYRVIAENATDIVCRMQPSGRFTYLSPSIASVLGYAPEELVGRKPTEEGLIHADDAEHVAERWAAMIAGRSFGRETLRFRGRHKSGRWLWLESKPTAVRDANGVATEVIDMIRDASAHVRLESELLAARDAAVAASQAKAEFLANMSHEIRTPLTGVIGFSQLLDEDASLTPHARRYAQRILTAGRTLLAVVNDILDFSKLEAGQIDLDPHSFDPKQFARETLDLVADQAAGKGLMLTLDCAEGPMPALVSADSARLRQVLLNLLTNAIKFTPAGGIHVQLSYGQAGDELLGVSVSDTGPGIPASLRHRLFQRFSQMDGSISREHGGTGLGLAICKSLVGLMGGEIGVESRLGEGSTFRFTIAAPEVDHVEAPATPDLAHSLVAARAEILIVDDAEANRDLVRAMLEAFGHSCEEAGGGAEAVEQAMRRRFDLILMDMQMPGMDGLAATRAIRATADANRATPVVALTANVLPEQVAACHDAGMNDHIAKPISPRELLEKVTYWTAVQPEAESRVSA